MVDTTYHISGNELLAQINGQSSSALESLFRQLYAPLCLIADNYVHNEEIAKDIVGELFLDLWKNKERLSQISEVKSYLYTAAKNKSLDYLKHNQVKEKHRTYVEQNSLIEEKSIDQAIYEAETLSLLYKAIEELPAECKQVVLLSLQGIPTGEIASQLKITPAAVSNQKSRAIRILKLKIPMMMVTILHGLFENN